MLIVIAAAVAADLPDKPVSHESRPPCISTSLATIANSGDLTTTDGGKYQILGEDFIDPASWRKGEPLRICMNWQNRDDQDPVLVDVFNLKRNETLVSTRQKHR